MHCMNTQPRQLCSLYTVQTALAQAVQEMANVEAPRLTAELLLGHVLGWDRVRILSNLRAPLAEEHANRFQALVQRRAGGEPLQYITGVQEFYGLSFLVSPAVLIPRPETEVLVEKAVSLIASRAPREVVHFVDVGTGSGCIAVSVAREVPRCSGWAVDISREALAIAQGNAVRHEVAARIQFICCDLLDSFVSAPTFDFILSNPPYVSQADAATLPRVVGDYEPHVALFSGESGLETYRRLIPQAAARLLPAGYFLLEVGAGQSDQVARLVEQQGLFLEGILEDIQGIPRCIVAHRI